MQPVDLCSVILQDLRNVVNDKTKVVALVHVSNVLGSRLDTAYIAELTHKVVPFLGRVGVLLR